MKEPPPLVEQQVRVGPWSRRNERVPRVGHKQALSPWICAARGGATADQSDIHRGSGRNYNSEDTTACGNDAVNRHHAGEGVQLPLTHQAAVSPCTGSLKGGHSFGNSAAGEDGGHAQQAIALDPLSNSQRPTTKTADVTPATVGELYEKGVEILRAGSDRRVPNIGNADHNQGHGGGDDVRRTGSSHKQSAHLKLRTMHFGQDGGADGQQQDDKAVRGGKTDGGIALDEEQAAGGIDSSGRISASIPPGVVCVLEHRAPEGSEPQPRFASFGTDVSRFAMFLDDAVRRGELVAPQGTRPAASIAHGENGAANKCGILLDILRPGGLEMTGNFPGDDGTGKVEMSASSPETVASTENSSSEVSPPDSSANSEEKEEEKGGYTSAKAQAEEHLAWARDATMEVAAGAGRWADQVYVTAVNVTDKAVNDNLRALWVEGRLLSQDRDAADIFRGGEKSFTELLLTYTSRTKFNHWEHIPQERLLTFLKEFHPKVHLCCGYDPDRPAEETRTALKNLLEWFRMEFPYYYDGCASCQNGENNTFVGYVYPSEDERAFKAGRTELYHCAACGAITHFARYGAVSKVLETRRGRCGEYSVLMLRFLEALGYECRWVVDWSDHVWTEAKIEGRWIHVDPCEAALDEPLLYESWGKNQTYIIAFTSDEVVDVTDKYTSDFEAAKARREMDEDRLRELIASATQSLQSP